MGSRAGWPTCNPPAPKADTAIFHCLALVGPGTCPPPGSRIYHAIYIAQLESLPKRRPSNTDERRPTPKNFKWSEPQS
jgi:hypothetical protein